MSVSTNHLQSRLASRIYVHDPADATVATKIAWVPITEYFMALAALVSGTGILTFKIFAALNASGGTPTLVKAHADPTVADAVGDNVVLEVSAEEVLAALPGATHVSVEIDCDATNDIVAVSYTRDGHRFGGSGLTADVISS